MIAYSRHNIDNTDIKEVVKVLKSESITQGKTIEKFEKKLCQKFKCKYCLVTSSGTAALDLVGKSLGWSKKSIIAVPSLTFVATALSALYSNSKTEFVDINEESYCVDSILLKNKIMELKKKKLKISAAIITDYAGHPSDWDNLKKLSKKFNFVLINDNCHSLGSKYKKDIGYASKYADVVIQSFHAVKNITTGEGGAIFTNNLRLYTILKELRSHSIKKNKPDYWNYDLEKIGYNYRLTDFQCALGISQLKKLSVSLKKKNLLAKKYRLYLNNVENLKLPVVGENIYHSYHLFPILINFNNLKISKDKFIDLFKSFKIRLQVHYPPIHKFTLFSKKNLKLNNTESYYNKTVSLPMHYKLNNKDIKYISDKIVYVLEKYKI